MNCDPVTGTCEAVVRVQGLKVNNPFRSSRRSSPAALKMCSNGVPGNSLNDTQSGRLDIPLNNNQHKSLILPHIHTKISQSLKNEGFEKYANEAEVKLSQLQINLEDIYNLQAMSLLLVFPKLQISLSAGPSLNLQLKMAPGTRTNNS